MSLIDLLRMSSGNLKRRKLRTFLTVLGVVIGTASIVVMISLGLGLQQSTYKEIEKSRWFDDHSGDRKRQAGWHDGRFRRGIERIYHR